MNYSYIDYSQSHDSSFDYSSSFIPVYGYSPLPSCPLHSPHFFYSTPIQSMVMPPLHYQQPQQVFSPPPTGQHVPVPNSDRTPLRRHQCFKKNQLQILHHTFNQDPHPSTAVLQQLASQLNVSIEKVRQWFKNRRHSEKQKKRSSTTQTSTTTTTMPS